MVHMGLHALPGLLASLDERRSRVHTVVALPTTAAADQPQVEAGYLEDAIKSSPRRVIVPLTPGVLAASAPLEGSVPHEALSPSVDGALVGLDDLIGATYFALCDDAVNGIVDVTLPGKEKRRRQPMSRGGYRRFGFSSFARPRLSRPGASWSLASSRPTSRWPIPSAASSAGRPDRAGLTNQTNLSNCS